MKTCPTDGKPMVIVYRHPVNPDHDIFQCDGDDTRPVGNRVHRFSLYDCVESKETRPVATRTVTCRECAKPATVILPVTNWACPTCWRIQLVKES